MFENGMRWFGNGIETELRRLHREMDRVLPTGARGEFPGINLWRDEHGLLLTTELAGVDPGDLEISIKGSSLTLAFKRETDEAQKAGRERWSGKLSRTIELPFTVEPGAVKARFSRGVLYLTLPEAQAEKAIRITVN